MKWNILPIDSFSDYQPAWDELNKAAHDVAVLNSHFIKSLIEHFASEQVVLAVGYRQSRIEYMLLMHKVSWARWATFMPSQAPICLMVHGKNTLNDEVMSSLCKALPGHVMQVDLLQIDTRQTHLPESGRCIVSDYIVTGTRPVPDNFDEYFKSLGKNLRQNYNKVINRAEKAGQKLECKHVSALDDVIEGVKKYGEIEAKSWKADLGTAIEPDNDQGRFYTNMMARLAEKNQACVWYYTIDDNIVACDLCIIQHHELIILKTTFDNDYAKSSPALQMKVDMLRYYSENPEFGIKNIEFFGKAMEWHKRLDSILRPIVHATWYNNILYQKLVAVVKSIKK
ncbi:GNAT family N-acetyltransferase [Neptunicella marina]|uniref:GNAT family N-acetyltransferase n=1 Tax=Neptunicella marina TaxID=2125989 RepID=A0A8J6M1S5_9ALTE|nr:GNAT family N-acetyltransferase [Neptunicella marina]MBC3765773.1 GNAT family N-acetyltransferase [Neptunicella marina]